MNRNIIRAFININIFIFYIEKFLNIHSNNSKNLWGDFQNILGALKKALRILSKDVSVSTLLPGSCYMSKGSQIVIKLNLNYLFI